MKHIRCWEYKKCGRELGGEHAEEFGYCPAALAPDNNCWLIAGTMCSGTIEGTYARKIDTCIICGYYNKMQDYHARRPRNRFFLFGQYLCSQGIINGDHVVQARALQLRNNQKIGVLAKSKGMLTGDQIQLILILQEETLKKFGELAVELGFLTEEQVRELVLEQEDNYLFFGEALVQLGVISEPEMFNHLKIYNAEKLQKHLEQEKIRSQLAGQ
ncbi:MAG: hypothetical protein HZA15_11360 [Nitrospirae bacterium]|nr:hypothetical protein [Nitrospirota bacterium]